MVFEFLSGNSPIGENTYVIGEPSPNWGTIGDDPQLGIMTTIDPVWGWSLTGEISYVIGDGSPIGGGFPNWGMVTQLGDGFPIGVWFPNWGSWFPEWG